MVHWFHKASLSVTTEHLPAEAYQLAASHQLGLPIKIYRDITSFYFMVLAGLMAMVCGVSFIFASSAAFSTKVGARGVPGSNISLYWLELGLGLTFLTIGLMLLVLSILQLMRKSRTYECTDGFVEVERTGRVVVSMRWDQIMTLWHRVLVSFGYRSGMTISHYYCVVGIDGLEHKIVYTHLRKRIEEELVQFSLSQVIAKYHTGEPISFGNIVVSIHGVRLGTDWFSWDEISPSSICKGENIVFFSKNSHKMLLIPISDTPNVCVLEALLKYIENHGSNRF